jgi:hypothetical protein
MLEPEQSSVTGLLLELAQPSLSGLSSLLVQPSLSGLSSLLVQLSPRLAKAKFPLLRSVLPYHRHRMSKRLLRL